MGDRLACRSLDKTQKVLHTKVSFISKKILFERISGHNLPGFFEKLIRCQIVENQVSMKSPQTAHKEKYSYTKHS
jgi:hypothetical protein